MKYCEIKEYLSELNFLDNEHKEFFCEKTLEVIGKRQNIDNYYFSLIYILGLCKTTREHFKEIFDIDKEEIDIDSIQKNWQTNTSVKVTRMAFSLWNGCNYDSENDIDNEKVSSKYNISEIFSCSYALYFFEGIKIRFPEYTNNRWKINENIACMNDNNINCLVENVLNKENRNQDEECL